MFEVKGNKAAARQTSEGRQRPPFAVNVIFTRTAATLKALRKAAELARDLEASIRIVATQVVSYQRPLEHPALDPRFRVKQLRTITGDGRIETRIDLFVCRDEARCLLETLREHSVVLIGVRRSWWMGRDQRLARRLRRAGHEVLLMEPEG